MTSMPFYVSPEQLMKDRADYARKGIARGRSVVVLGYDKGIAFVAENPSRALHKVSEIYDRIAFAAVGKYNEFENLRVAGVRYADLRGYSYDRTDVTARGLANAYAQTLGTVFTQESKPYEVEIVVAEVGTSADDDQIYRLTYDGSVADELGFVAMGGAAEPIETALKDRWSPGLSLGDALSLAVGLLGQDPGLPRTGRRHHADPHGGPARGGRARPRAAAPDLPPDRWRPARRAAEHRRPDQRRAVRGRPDAGPARHPHRRGQPARRDHQPADPTAGARVRRVASRPARPSWPPRPPVRRPRGGTPATGCRRRGRRRGRSGTSRRRCRP